MSDPSYDPWADYRQRREEWRARRCERREARRERRAARRAHWYGLAGGADFGAPPERDSATKTRIADMQVTIDRLLERVAVLEKLATDDDRRLASEIEKLRNPEPRT